MIPFNSATYNALQTRLLRRMSGGSLGVSYTWSKSINYADNSDSGPSWNGPSMWGRNKAVAGFSRRHNLQMFGSQQLPFGRNKKLLNHGIASKIAGGWQLNGTSSIMAGRPFTVGSSPTSVNTVGNAQTGDQVKEDVEFYGRIGRGESYFDPNSFMPVTDVRFGNSGRNILTGPGVVNVDGSLFRSFRLKEKVNMQFRWEVFNVSNTPAFGNPGATVSSASRNPDGTVRSTGGWTEVTSASATERRMRFALKILF
jgi:hypothetical protein